MTATDARKLKVGDTVRNGSLKGVVSVVTTNYVQLIWVDRHGYDVLRKNSPLWYSLELVE